MRGACMIVDLPNPISFRNNEPTRYKKWAVRLLHQI